MRILLKHTKSGLYLIGPDKWTADANRACNFRFIDRAISYASTWALKEVELAFAFTDPPSVTLVPLEKTALKYSLA